MNYTTTASTVLANTFSIADMEKALEKLRGMPPAKWLLIAPDGRVWTGDNPMNMAAIAGHQTYFNSMILAPKETS